MWCRVGFSLGFNWLFLCYSLRGEENMYFSFCNWMVVVNVLVFGGLVKSFLCSFMCCVLVIVSKGRKLVWL